MKVIFVIAFLAVSASAQYPSPAPAIIDEPPVYAFNYNVDNIDNYEVQKFGQEEDRDADSTHGEYRVALPDGRTQIVTYQVYGDSGFVADVQYEGEILPYTPPKPAPIYKPAPPPAPKPAPIVYKPLPPAPVVYKPLPPPPPPVVYKTLPPPAPKPAPVVYKPLPPPPPPAYKPAPAPKPAPPRKEYGPVRFNPFG